jgi:hypothetical protein
MGGDRFRPIGGFLRETRPAAIAAQRDIRPGGNGNVAPAGEVQSVAGISGPAAAIVGDGGDGEQLNLRPVKDHCQGAQIIHIAA